MQDLLNWQAISKVTVLRSEIEERIGLANAGDVNTLVKVLRVSTAAQP